MEPPQISSSIPYIGHIWGLMGSKFNYYVQLSQQTDLPIFTMTVPGTQMYIVTTPELIQAIQKQPKVLAFSPIEAKFSNQICGTSQEAHDILMTNVNGDQGDWGLSMESYTAMKAALAPGAGLDKMNRVMMDDVAKAVQALIPDDITYKTLHIGLNGWLRDMVTTATTNSVYGPQNPFKDQEIQDAFWDFEIVTAFENFFKSGGHEQASLLLQNRYETSIRHNVSVEDISRYEVGGAVAILVNTAPAVFWMLLYLYSSPSLLDAVRSEIYVVAGKSAGGSVTSAYNLDITAVKKSCPLLASTLQEVLRLRTVGTSIRQVMEDTILDGQWLLKKDAMIQMPSRVIHTDDKIWGTGVADFNPRRFMKGGNTASPSGKRPSPAAFRAFGGGTTLCPGRHFATNEILAVVVMVVMQYDLKPRTGKWEMPTCNNTNVAAVVMGPDTDVDVEISRRSQAEQKSWSFVLQDSTEIFALAAEDSVK